MGRELKRVAIDFEWPLHMIWKGYINPYNSQKCTACDCTGYNPATKQIADDWYAFEDRSRQWSHNITQDEVDALVAEERLWDFTRTFIPGRGWIEIEPKPVVTADMVNEWSKTGLGHDCINKNICVRTRAKRLGVYGDCPVCNGEGEIWFSDEVKKLNEEWEEYEPPTGDGYQLWETTSEGSPISPLFTTLDALCEWASENATTFGEHKTSAERWKEMLVKDFVHVQVGNATFI